jgi:hypothetical protein
VEAKKLCINYALHALLEIFVYVIGVTVVTTKSSSRCFHVDDRSLCCLPEVSLTSLGRSQVRILLSLKCQRPDNGVFEVNRASYFQGIHEDRLFGRFRGQRDGGGS